MQNSDNSNISIITSQESEEQPSNLERDLFEITSISITQPRNCSIIFGKHQNCANLCNELLTINTIRIFPIQDNRIHVEPLSYDRAINVVQRMLRFRINFRIQRKKQMLKYPHNQQQKDHLLDVIQQLIIDKVKDTAISSLLNLSAKRTKFLKQSLRLRQFVNIRFEFEKIHESWIIEYLKTSQTYQTINSDQIYVQFLKKFNIPSNKLTKTRFIKFLKQCNITYKSVRFRTLRALSIRRKEIVAQFCLQLVSYQQKGFRLLYLDETTFSRKDKPYKVWQLKKFDKIHQSCELKVNISIIGVIGENYFSQYQLLEGTSNSFVFLNFLNDIVWKIKKYYKNQKTLLIMDNCRIHKVKLVQSLILNKIDCLFTPPYTPQLNTIEHLWSIVKDRVKKCESRTKNQLIFNIHQQLCLVPETIIERLIQHQYYVILKGLKSEI